MKLKDYDFLNCKDFPVEFFCEDDYYRVIEVYGVLRDGTFFKGLPLVFFDITKHIISDVFKLNVYKLSDFINVFGNFDLLSKHSEVEKIKVKLGMYTTDGLDYIILDEFAGHFYKVRDLYNSDNSYYYFPKADFEDIREEMVEKELIDGRAE